MGMRFVFKVGPFQPSDQPPHAMYIVLEEGGGMDCEPAMTDDDGVGRLRERGSTDGAFCEPALAAIAGKHRLQVRRLPEWFRHAKAAMSMMTVNSDSVAVRDLAVLMALVEAAAVFFKGTPWHRWESHQLFDVQVQGGMSHLFEAAVLGAHGPERGLLLYFRVGDCARLDDAARRRDRRLARSVETLALLYGQEELDPILSAVQVATGARFTPILLRTRLGALVAATEAEIAALIAALKAMADLGRASDEGKGDCAVGRVPVTATAKRRVPM
jgi:hypothetical protein